MKNRALGLVALVVWALVIVGPTPAVAIGDSCGTWNHATRSGTGCVYLSQAPGSVKANVSFSFSGNGSNNCIAFDFDWVKLFRDGAQVEMNGANAQSCVGQIKATGPSFTAGCHNWQAQARYIFRHSVGGPGFMFDGHNSGWITRSSNVIRLCL